MTALNPEILYNMAQNEKVPFYQYNEWVNKKGMQVLFEGMFLKKKQKDVGPTFNINDVDFNMVDLDVIEQMPSGLSSMR